MEERIVNLEMLVAMQDETLGDLSKELYRQQQEVQRMALQIKLLEQKLQEQKEAPQIGENEKPPHY